MPLKVVLKPGETLVVNGAVIGSGDRTATIFLHNEAQFLRGREMLRPEEAVGPERALYLAIQLAYLNQGSEQDVHTALAAMRRARPDAVDDIAAIAELLSLRRHYQALRRCRALFPRLEGEAA
ncbi:flagellar biosynthesis repressor FlbT [Elioraea rosea]|uniref:flagellar biosynthesis repressor FlbT n=1 Tax=Elioraea rosea TaxID=2492390 RepID=UPI0013156E33|nr:flagellar biosynthesis repressor FlbT [Elioraea rosea]